MTRRRRRATPEWLRRSYAAKLLVALAAVSLAIGLVGGALYVQTGQMLEQETRRELESAAQIEAQALDEWFEKMRLQTRTVAEASALQSGDDSETVQYLWRFVERDDDIEAAYFVDTGTGRVVTSVGSSSIISSQGVLHASGQRDFTARAPDRNRVVVSKPFRPYEGSAPVILLSAAVPDRPNRSIVTVVNLRQLSSSEAHSLDRARFQVVDGDGTVVMAENGSRILGPNRFAARPGDESGFVVTGHDGQRSAVGYAAMDTRNWTVTARMTTGSAFALRSAVLEGVLTMLGAVVVGLGVLSLVLTRITVRPIRDLAATARDLQDGELDEPIETDREDEFGDLYAALDEMRASLARQIERAEQSRLEAQNARTQAELARRESEQLTEHLEQEADRFGRVMAACADGELDRRLEPSSNSESMREIADAFNDMMDDVQAQKEQLEAFTSIISHDLRNPLTVAHGRAALLEEETDSEHVDALVDSLERMQAIVEDGLMLARGTSVEDPTTVDVAARARRAWSHVDGEEATLQVRNVGTIDADPSLLEQIFENLFRNAIEHARPDVTVTVTGEPWGFAVEDDGPGLPDSAESVFEPGVSDGSGDSGLGLTIVRRIASAHGWDVRGRNGDSGARFEFVLTDTRNYSGDGAMEQTVDGVDWT